MKTILAYGDSLTFGANPQTGGPRHAYEDRWPAALEAALGGDARVIAEGLCGRTTVYDDFASGSDLNGDRTSVPDLNGGRILPTLLASHAPLDLVIIMLGTNDLKPAVCGTALGASIGMSRLAQIIRDHFAGPGEIAPQILFVAPPHACQGDNADMMAHWDSDVVSQSRLFARHYLQQSQSCSAGFFDAASVAIASPLDGIHLDAANTRAIGVGLAPTVKSMLGLKSEQNFRRPYGC